MRSPIFNKINNNTLPNSGHNLPEYSVSEFSGKIKGAIEKTFSRVRVRGEISGFKEAASGHVYFSLKDEKAILDSVCWRNTAARLTVRPEDGMEVIVTGRVTTFSGRSKYQIVAESIELAGEGALLKLLEDRKRKLSNEGLFDEAKKRKIPFLPDIIGIITSPTGAVIQDILHRLSDRFPRHVLLWPVRVQGDGAAKEIEKAIKGFNRIQNSQNLRKPDVIIVARGGGSLEDLWPFNEEDVVRAASECNIPLISAIGHETDWTLIDFAADFRAPTPTAAAEVAVPVRIELLNQVKSYGERLNNLLIRNIQLKQRELKGLGRVLPKPRRSIEEASQKVDELFERLASSVHQRLLYKFEQAQVKLLHPKHNISRNNDRISTASRTLNIAIKNILKKHMQSLVHATDLMESFSHQRVLERGFTLIFNEKNQTISSARGIKPNQKLSILFHDGETNAISDGKNIFTAKDEDPEGTLL